MPGINAEYPCKGLKALGDMHTEDVVWYFHFHFHSCFVFRVSSELNPAARMLQ